MVVLSIAAAMGLTLVLVLVWGVPPAPYLPAIMAGLLTMIIGPLALRAEMVARRQQAADAARPGWAPPWAAPRGARKGRAQPASTPAPPWRIEQEQRQREASSEFQATRPRPNLRMLVGSLGRPLRPVPPPPNTAETRGGGPMAPHPSPRLAIVASNAIPPLPVAVAGVAGTMEQALRSLGVSAKIGAISTNAQTIDVELASSEPLSAAQQRSLKEALGVFSSAARWVGPALQIPMPQRMPATTALPCVPVLRRRRALVWWPALHSDCSHILITGDGMLTLGAVIGSLRAASPFAPLRFVVHDPDRQMQGLHIPGMEPTADALATARMRALQVAWAREHDQAVPEAPPLVLVAINPDEVVWRDLMPLLRHSDQGVHVVALLTTSGHIAEMREACHRIPVVEVIGPTSEPLPDSYHPSGVTIPRSGEVVAWRGGRMSWRGTPLVDDEASLQREWLER